MSERPDPAERRPFVRRVKIRVSLGALTVLVGRNGAGKSNFLDALRFVADSPSATIQVVKPFRLPKGKLLPGKTGARRVDGQELRRALDTASTLLKYADSSARKFAILICDADEDLACEIASRILAEARVVRADLDLACVIANREYETWFIAAGESLVKYLAVRPGDEAVMSDPEGRRSHTGARGEKWVSDRFRGPSYQKTIDQAKLTGAMDLALCRARSPSFDKLCREVQRRVVADK